VPAGDPGGLLTCSPQVRRDDANAAPARRIVEDGYLMLSTTMLRGRTVLRMCTINPRTTDEEIAGVVERIEALAAAEGARRDTTVARPSGRVWNPQPRPKFQVVK